MELTATVNNRAYPFNVSVFEDRENGQYNYLIQFSDQPPLIVQKDITSGDWFSVPAGAITGDLQDAIFTQIDSANIETDALTVIHPIEDLNQYFYTRVEWNASDVYSISLAL